MGIITTLTSQLTAIKPIEAKEPKKRKRRKKFSKYATKKYCSACGRFWPRVEGMLRCPVCSKVLRDKPRSKVHKLRLKKIREKGD